MKRINNRKFRLKYWLKCWDKDGVLVISAFRTVKAKVVTLACSTQWHKANIRVVYGRDIENESDHENLESLVGALNAYTEKSMLDFVEGDVQQ